MKWKIILFVGLFLGGVVGMLAYNKSIINANSAMEKLSAIPVKIASPTKQRMEDQISMVGTIVANRDVAIIAETQGRVTWIGPKIGDAVTAGSPIAQVDNELKQAAFTTAEVNLEKTKKDLERSESLYKEKAISDQQIEAARLAFQSADAQYVVARRQLRDTKITSPISGVLSARNIEEGTTILDKMNIGNVVDISKLKLKVNAAEMDVFRLKLRDAAEVTTDVYPGVIFKGKVHTISDKGDEAHTYPVEILLENNSTHPLKAGMFGRVAFSFKDTQETLMIPRDAIIGSIKNAEVFVTVRGIAQLRKIIIGRANGLNVQVLSGLTESDAVVISGQSNLKDQALITIIQ